jgi:hypothetical protein
MRPFEMALWLACSVSAAGRLVMPARGAVDLGLMIVAVALAGLHVFTEGARVHMIPTYLLGAALIGMALRGRRSRIGAVSLSGWIRVGLHGGIFWWLGGRPGTARRTEDQSGTRGGREALFFGRNSRHPQTAVDVHAIGGAGHSQQRCAAGTLESHERVFGGRNRITTRGRCSYLDERSARSTTRSSGAPII